MSVGIALQITGIVQGVGFRPHVFRLAHELGLGGSIRNDADGVFIRLKGPQYRLDDFIASLRASPPPLARIDAFEILADDALDLDENHFVIEQSKAGGEAQVVVSPDKSMCPECLADINNPDDRHYRYPFTNCTNCGPRYTLIKALPYDRKHTSMAQFAMCPECEAEYKNPLDRRYHAQPVSCPRCGPGLSLTTPDGALISSQNDVCMDECVRLIKEGAIFAIKGLGGFHLVCDATNEAAVERLRERKVRPAKPLAVMVNDLDMAKTLALGSEEEWQLLESRERPIVVMRKATRPTSNLGEALSDTAQPSLAKAVAPALAEAVAPGIDRIGLFLPYTPLHALLLDALRRPIVATSANRSGEPIIIEASDIHSKLSGVVDYILDHNRPIVSGCDDSVVQWCAGQLQVIRMARGYAPMALHSHAALSQQLMAVGPQQKNTLGFGVGHNLFLSPHIGDLFSIEAEDYFIRTLQSFKRLYDVNPTSVIADSHPDYAPSRFARNYVARDYAARGYVGSADTIEAHETATGVQARELVTVQHHFAHVLSVMAVNNTTGPVLGFSFDGTGLGDDGSLWGGEVMLCTATDYKRLGGLMPFALPGGDKASHEPWRLVIALLHDSVSAETLSSLGCLSHLSPAALGNHIKVAARSHVLKSSSMGRLFDAVAALLGLCNQIQFEGQAGMLLEAAAARANANSVNLNEAQTNTFSTSTVSTIAASTNTASTIADSTARAQANKDQVTQRLFAAFLSSNAGSNADSCLESGVEIDLETGVSKNLTHWNGAALMNAMLHELTELTRSNTDAAEFASARDTLAAAFIDTIALAIADTAKRFPKLPIVLTGGVFQSRTLANVTYEKLINAGHTVLPWGEVPVNDGGIALGQLWYGAHIFA
ncbi:carbamoyltransferase HypF [Shewanella sp. JM162201]|uniref:acylphosphatase n=1 Tax=Shewanella jiangmenensis TaxID=2837387 RepID=A0ABS5V6E0_9GAMM|nr:carbamoyltransferase HypF [Shewanella jiangmenensis]MBT1446009.1 carbamoyltransferase HypF [Shewanella jiangmenensis]